MSELKIEASKDELAGIPQDLVAKFKNESNKFEINFYQSETVLIFAKNEQLRSRLIAMRNIGDANMPVLGQIIAKRNQHAELLGFKSYTEQELDPMMSKSPANVEKFLDRVIKGLQKQAEKEIKSLTDLKRSTTGNKTDELTAYDFQYFVD